MDITKSFEFKLPTRVLFGVNQVDSLGEEVKALGVQRLLLVTDRGVVNAGLRERVLDGIGSPTAARAQRRGERQREKSQGAHGAQARSADGGMQAGPRRPRTSGQGSASSKLRRRPGRAASRNRRGG